MSMCKKLMISYGLAAPRTCSVCKLGKCTEIEEPDSVRVEYLEKKKVELEAQIANLEAQRQLLVDSVQMFLDKHKYNADIDFTVLSSTMKYVRGDYHEVNFK
jgi:hypothetical protein